MKAHTLSYIFTSKGMLFFACLLALFPFLGCGKKPMPTQKIEGQVFIVLKSGQSLKLGAAPVMLVGSNAAMAHLRVTEQVAYTNFSNLSVQASDTIAELNIQVQERERLERGLQDLNARLKEIDVLLEELKRSRIQQRSLGAQMKASGERLTPAEVAELNRLNAISIKYDKAINEHLPIMRSNQTWAAKQLILVANRIDELKIFLKTAQSNMENELMPRPLLNQSWPAILSSTMTDADGKFSLNFPVGTNLMIIAFGRREVFGTQEDYLWVLPASTAEGDHILLNNGNVFHFSEKHTQ